VSTTADRTHAAPGAAPGLERVSGSSLSFAVTDTFAITGRNLTILRRSPQLLVFATIQPVIFVLLFRYVFGGAIHASGYASYIDYLMPGIFVQTITFGALNTGVGLAQDLHTGLIERFRSLPMARSAVLGGRTVADLIRNVFVVALMLGVGYLVGFRLDTTFLKFWAGIGILLLFAFSLSWLFAIVGLTAPNAETAQAGSLPLLAVLVFASSAFVPVSTMPSWLQAFANHQPVSVTVNAVRGLLVGGPAADQLGRNVVQSLAWSAAIIGVCGPVAVRMYRKAE
jgi:ABC-2 type transport system permease protein/oleandomycin transport system permease protein